MVVVSGWRRGAFDEPAVVLCNPRASVELVSEIRPVTSCSELAVSCSAENDELVQANVKRGQLVARAAKVASQTEHDDMSSCVQQQRLRTGMSLFATTDKYMMTLGSVPMPLAGVVPMVSAGICPSQAVLRIAKNALLASKQSLFHRRVSHNATVEPLSLPSLVRKRLQLKGATCDNLARP